jgi:hypothetical protein
MLMVFGGYYIDPRVRRDEKFFVSTGVVDSKRIIFIVDHLHIDGDNND